VGSSLRFIETAADTGGERVAVEISYSGAGDRPPVHLHPSQRERFEVLEGEIHAVAGGTKRVLRPGDELEIPPGVPHRMWADEPSRQRWETAPALRTEAFFETLWGLQQDGHTDERGVPALPQMALILRHFSDEYRLAKPPPIVQSVVFPLLAIVARVQGRSATYSPA
jgi:quercetin dioxygenase-like cupin family protein